MELTPEEFKTKVKNEFITISRVPSKTREEFIGFANTDFCGDYGMTLKTIWDQFIEYQFMKQSIFGDVTIKLDHIINLIKEREDTKSSVDKKGIKLLSGKTLKGGNE